MNSTRVRRSTFMAAIAAFAVVVLSGCINITYSLNVNPDSTLSGKIELSVTKQAASILGIDSPEDLNSKLQSGELTDQSSAETFQSCVASETEENLVLSCDISNVTATDINENWSMTTEGDVATFTAVSDASTNSESAGIPGISQGEYEFTLTFPGEISSITGSGAVKTGPNTMTIKGSLEDPLSITVVGALNNGSSSMVWIYVLLGVLAIAAIAVLGIVLRTGSRASKSESEPAVEAAPQTPAIDGTPAQSAIEAVPEAPTDAPQGDAHDSEGQQ